MPVAGTTVGTLICFESVFPDLCRDGVREGSQLFVNVTHDGWFGDTPGPYQHGRECGTWSSDRCYECSSAPHDDYARLRGVWSNPWKR